MKNILLRKDTHAFQLNYINILTFKNFLSLIDYLDNIYCGKINFFNSHNCAIARKNISLVYITPLNINKHFDINGIKKVFSTKYDKIAQYLDIDLDNEDIDWHSIEWRIKLSFFIGLKSETPNVFLILDVFDFLNENNKVLLNKLITLINIVANSKKHLIIFGSIENSFILNNINLFNMAPEIITLHT